MCRKHMWKETYSLTFGLSPSTVAGENASIDLWNTSLGRLKRNGTHVLSLKPLSECNLEADSYENLPVKKSPSPVAMVTDALTPSDLSR